jgi:O-antigen/teichoic acid export membrane protein
VQKWIESWRQDRLLRGVLRSSSYLFSSNSLMAVLSMLQGILVARLVGMEGLGLVTTIITLASNFHRLLSFRMSEVVVKYLTEALEQRSPARAAGIVKTLAGVEMLTSSAAFVGLVWLSPWAARYLAQDGSTTEWFVFYGWVLVGNLVYETSLGVLQSVRRFDRLAQFNVVQSLLTAGLIAWAYLNGGGVFSILLAYLAGKVFTGAAVAWAAGRELKIALGPGWWRLRPQEPVAIRGMLVFSLNTNLHGTVNLFTRDNIPLLLAALRPQAEVGYFKLALSLINLVMLPIEPLIWPTYTEVTRLISSRQWSQARRLLGQVSWVSAAWTVGAGGFLALTGYWLIPLIYKTSAAPAYPAVLILLIGYGFANIFNWNRPLLLALGRPDFPLRVNITAGIVELMLIFWLVPGLGYLTQAAILSLYFVVSIGVAAWRGLRELSQMSLAGQAA